MKTKTVKVLALVLCLQALSACTDIVRRYKMSEDEAASFFLRFGFDSTAVLSQASPTDSNCIEVKIIKSAKLGGPQTAYGTLCTKLWFNRYGRPEFQGHDAKSFD